VTPGFCIWLTGLTASGKTTTSIALARALRSMSLEVVVVDGDDVRRRLSPDLGYGDTDRQANVRRIGVLARDVVSSGAVAICAAVSPFRAGREECRVLIGPSRFVEVFVDTPLDVCEERDPRGLYRRARRGEVTHVSGLDAPYEPPLAPDVVLDTERDSVEASVSHILTCLRARRLVQSVSD
jgi:adenylyl-sulfate kinase